jgi:hypothetical protein
MGSTSIAFMLFGLISILGNPVTGLCLITISLLLLPPVRKKAFQKYNVPITTNQRSISIFVLIVASFFFTGQNEQRRAEETAQQEQQEAKEHAAALLQSKKENFEANREKIIASLKSALEKGDYRGLIAQAKEYLPVQDPEVAEINKQANMKLVEIQKQKRLAQQKAENEKRTENILVQLKGIPVSAYRSNQRLYQELVDMNANVPLYQEKLSFYSAKVAEEVAKEKAEKRRREEKYQQRVAAFGEPPTQSAWDGSYYEVERYLKRIANDPESIDISGCTGVYHNDQGWLVGCDYRGRNGFGGMVRQSNWFSISHGTVINMHESSAFSP